MHTQQRQSAQHLQDQQLVRTMLGLNLGAILISYLSTRWDVAEHAKGAVDSFWYPPHYGIYFGLLMAALLSLAGLAVVFRGPGLPFEKLRQNPALSFVAVLNGLSFLGAPFDAWWHETFGLDLSSWSPPHIHLIVSTVIVILGCMVYFLDDNAVNAPLQRFQPRSRQSAIQVFGMLLSLLVLMVLFLEYEQIDPVRTPAFILARPLWFYPLTWTTITLFMSALYVGLTRRIGLLSLGLALYVIVRLLLLGVDRTLFVYEGTPFYPLVVPALVLDLALIALNRSKTQPPTWRGITMAMLASSVTLVLTTPLLWAFFNITTDYTVQPWLSYGPIMIVVGMLSGLAGWWCGTRLRQLRPRQTMAPVIQQPALAN